MKRLYRDRKDRKHVHRRGHGGSLAVRTFLLESSRNVPKRVEEWFASVADAMKGRNPIRKTRNLSGVR